VGQRLHASHDADRVFTCELQDRSLDNALTISFSKLESFETEEATVIESGDGVETEPAADELHSGVFLAGLSSSLCVSVGSSTCCTYSLYRMAGNN
jgi:hypothetical protein